MIFLVLKKAMDMPPMSKEKKRKRIKTFKTWKTIYRKKQKTLNQKKYGDVFGNSPESFQQANEDGTIKEFNEINLSMHKQLWDRINRSIKKKS